MKLSQQRKNTIIAMISAVLLFIFIVAILSIFSFFIGTTDKKLSIQFNSGYREGYEKAVRDIAFWVWMSGNDAWVNGQDKTIYACVKERHGWDILPDGLCNEINVTGGCQCLTNFGNKP